MSNPGETTPRPTQRPGCQSQPNSKTNTKAEMSKPAQEPRPTDPSQRPMPEADDSKAHTKAEENKRPGQDQCLRQVEQIQGQDQQGQGLKESESWACSGHGHTEHLAGQHKGQDRWNQGRGILEGLYRRDQSHGHAGELPGRHKDQDRQNQGRG